MAFAGFLIAQNKLPLVLTSITAFLGSAVGITVSYIIGLTIGNYLIHKYGPRIGLTEERIEQVHNWFERIGKWTLFVGYFVPGVRHLTGYVAGTSRLHFLHFAFFAYSGALLWSQAFLFLGYYFGNKWEKVVDLVGNYSFWIAIDAAIIIVVLYLLWRFVVRGYWNKK